VADSPRIEELKRRVQSDPASIAFAALAEEYRRAGRFGEAIETCNTGLVRHPSYLSAHVTLGRALIEVGRLQEARTELEYVLKLAPENLAAIRGLAEIHHRIGPVEDVVEPAETSLPPAPAAVETHEPAAAPIPRIALKVRVAEPPHAPAPDLPMRAAEQPEMQTPVSANAVDERPEQPIPDPVLTTIDTRSVETPSATQPHTLYARPVDPALAGLEEFLNAIVRARAERAPAR
jgi:tetratricopeptide (TPR) repeat protein